MVLYSSVSVGAASPFKVIHVSDTHLTLADSRDNSEKNRMALSRRRIFPFAESVRDNAEALARELGCLIIHTGDYYDFLTEANLDELSRFVSENDVIYAAGNHDFSHYLGEEFEDEEYKLKSCERVQSLHNNNIRMSSRVINGVNFVVLDDSYYQFHPDHPDFLLREAEKGLPMVLMYHKPVCFSEMLDFALEKKRLGGLVGIPEEYVDGRNEFWNLEHTMSDATRRTVRLIDSLENVKCIINGHLHEDFECHTDRGVPMILTGCESIRVIEFT